MNQDFETLRDELEHALGGLDARQTQLRAADDPTRWTIQQTVGHLLMTYAVTESVFDARIAKGTATQAKPSIVQRAAQGVIIRAGLFPPGRKAPAMVTPGVDEAAVPSGVLIERVEQALKSLDMRVMEGEKIFGAQRRAISHIILGPLSVGQWRRFHLIHGRHHMKCIARVRREFGV